MNTKDLISVDVEELGKKQLENFMNHCAKFLIGNKNLYYTDSELEVAKLSSEFEFDKDCPPIKETYYSFKFRDDKLDKFEQAKLIQHIVKKEYKRYLDSPVTRREYNELLERLNRNV